MNDPTPAPAGTPARGRTRGQHRPDLHAAVAGGAQRDLTAPGAGRPRVLVFGEVRNSNTAPAQHVVVVAEGLDESGRVVSRARGYVLGVLPSRGSAPFELRMLAAGSEKRYRVQIESFEF